MTAHAGEETPEQLHALDEWVQQRLRSPKFAGSYIHEVFRKKRGVTDAEHAELKQLAIRRLARAHGVRLR